MASELKDETGKVEKSPDDRTSQLFWNSRENENETGGVNGELKRKVSRISNEQIQKNLCRFPFYHGYLLHEYQPMLIKSYGDFLMRVSIRSNKKATVRRTNRESGNQTSNQTFSKANVVIGVYTKDDTVSQLQVVDTAKSIYADCIDETRKKNDIVDLPMMIEQDSEGKWTQFFVEKKKKFNSIDELIEYYKTNPGTYRDRNKIQKKFQLLKGIPLCVWELDRTKLEIGTKLLGEGAFGEVRNGIFKVDEHEKMPVAVKSLKCEESKDCIKEMMHEARLQLCMRNKNVLRTVGVCILKTPLFIITEYCEHGALREYLKKNHCDTEEKVKFALGSAKGVEYIHKKLLIHRDLATRNVLLTETNVPKIADFGLARFGSSYKPLGKAKFPIRYLAPETLATYKFSLKSDVYAFGLLIWEIFENGTEPYTKAQPHQESIVPKGSSISAAQFKEIIKRELWVKFPSDTPPSLEQFVTTRIFTVDDKKRPTMSEVAGFLKGIYSDCRKTKNTVVTVDK